MTDWQRIQGAGTVPEHFSGPVGNDGPGLSNPCALGYLQEIFRASGLPSRMPISASQACPALS